MADNFNISLLLLGSAANFVEDLRRSGADALVALETGEGGPSSSSSPLALLPDEELTASCPCWRRLAALSFSRNCVTIRGFCARLPPNELPRSGILAGRSVTTIVNDTREQTM